MSISEAGREGSPSCLGEKSIRLGISSDYSVNSQVFNYRQALSFDECKIRGETYGQLHMAIDWLDSLDQVEICIQNNCRTLQELLALQTVPDGDDYRRDPYILGESILTKETAFTRLFVKDWQREAEISLLEGCVCAGLVDGIDKSLYAERLTKVERTNLFQLRNKVTHWHHIAALGGLRIPAWINQCLFHTKPLGTILISKETGGILLYPFSIQDIILAPIYSGWINQFQGVAVITRNSFRIDCPNNSVKHHLVAKAQDILLCIKKLTKEKINIKCSTEKSFILVGQRINFGHTIIQDSSLVESWMAIKSSGRQYGLILGSYDYLCSLDLIKSRPDFTSLECEILEDFLVSQDIYSLPQETYPLPTMRPTTGGLNNYMNNEQSEDRATSYHEKCFYYNVDSREGRRKCMNYPEITSVVAAQLKRRGIHKVVVDSQTSFPRYTYKSGKIIADDNVGSSLQSLEYTAIIRKLELEGLRVEDWHGLTLIQKLERTRAVDFACGLASYGSSMIIPIYIANIPTIIFGCEVHNNAFKSWFWHTSRYCHQRRVDQAYFVKSLTTDSGYHVNTKFLFDILKKALKPVCYSAIQDATVS